MFLAFIRLGKMFSKLSVVLCYKVLETTSDYAENAEIDHSPKLNGMFDLRQRKEFWSLDCLVLLRGA